jgi:hypothetical protein
MKPNDITALVFVSIAALSGIYFVTVGTDRGPSGAKEAAPVRAAPAYSTTQKPKMFALAECRPDQGNDCTQDFFQKVWQRIEADTGEFFDVDTSSIQHVNNGSAIVAVYTHVPNTAFDFAGLRRLMFDCAGHFRDITAVAPGITKAPPHSVAGQIAKIACDGARDTRIEDANKDNGTGESSAQYCASFSSEACDRIKDVIRSRERPTYCRPGFAILRSEANKGLTDEQIRICYLMTENFTRLSTQ